MVWHKTVSAKALEKTGGVSIKVAGEIIFATKMNGKFYAMNGVCSHAKCVLGHAEKDGLKVKCPCHDAEFELETGKMVTPPSVAPNAPMDKLGLKTYPIKEENGFIEIDL